jgi:hypothetical protein
MGVFSQITQTLRHLVTEKLLTGLRILSGNGEELPENRPNAPVSTDRPIEEDAKIRLSSNQLGRYGNR